MTSEETVKKDIKAGDEELVPLICIEKSKGKVVRRQVAAVPNALDN